MSDAGAFSLMKRTDPASSEIDEIGSEQLRQRWERAPETNRGAGLCSSGLIMTYPDDKSMTKRMAQTAEKEVAEAV